MALIAWDEVSWADFVAGLEGYRDHFTRAANAPEAHAKDAAEIVALLNKWACRLSTTHAPAALEAWLDVHRTTLEGLEPLSIVDHSVPALDGELGELHDELVSHMQARGVRNMGPAAASKTLHLLQPRLFVMWDREISRSAPHGYHDYLLRMHRLARRLSQEAPAQDLEAYLQDLLGYEMRKTLAKYLDEFNWFEAVGRDQLAARSR